MYLLASKEIFIAILFGRFSGTLVNSIGFEWMLVGIAILCFIYAPLLTFLRAPPTKEEKKVGDGDVIDSADKNANVNKAVNANVGICNGGYAQDRDDAMPTPTSSPIISHENFSTKL